MPFIPCPSCRRHVRGSDTTCPFCATALPSDHASRAVPSTTTRLGRGALFAFAVSVSACGASTEGEPITDTGLKSDAVGADTSVTDTGNPVAAYGGPPIDSAVPDTSKADTGIEDDGAPAAAYGLPPMDGG